jgi:hypothetical protein
VDRRRLLTKRRTSSSSLFVLCYTSLISLSLSLSLTCFGAKETKETRARRLGRV